jgi:hypothetical protein
VKPGTVILHSRADDVVPFAHSEIKKAQEEYPGIVHFLRIDKEEDLDADLTSWLQEAYDHRKQKDQGRDDE